jgi:hypothetical protein
MNLRILESSLGKEKSTLRGRVVSIYNSTDCVYNNSTTTNKNNIEYSTEHNEYSGLTKLEKIGQRRIKRLTKEYEKLGYFVLSHPYNQTGIDMIIIATPSGKIMEVLEVTNYAYNWEYIKTSKFNRYVATLNEFNCFNEVQKTLVVSYWENLTSKQIQILKKNSINTRVVGFQD